MADLTVSATGVKRTSSTVIQEGTAGATITAGQPVYADSANNYVLKPCQATSQAAAQCVGIALHGAASGQPLRYAADGDVIFSGTTMVMGTCYVVSANAGGIAPSADLDASTAANYGTFLGISTNDGTNNILRLGIAISNILNP